MGSSFRFFLDIHTIHTFTVPNNTFQVLCRLHVVSLNRHKNSETDFLESFDAWKFISALLFLFNDVFKPELLLWPFEFSVISNVYTLSSICVNKLMNRWYEDLSEFVDHIYSPRCFCDYLFEETSFGPIFPFLLRIRRTKLANFCSGTVQGSTFFIFIFCSIVDVECI